MSPHQGAPLSDFDFDRDRFIDIHTHILPGIDDGARDMAETLRIAQLYTDTGVKRVVATPHFIPGPAWAPSKTQILDVTGQVQHAIDERGIDLQVMPGMEIGYHRKIEERIARGDLLPLGDSEHYLIEPPFYESPKELLASLTRLLEQGVPCILAHPERIAPLLAEIEALEFLVHHGLLIQITAGSFLGAFGTHTAATAHNLRDRGFCHFIASDTHSLDKRRPLNEDDWQRLLNAPETAAVLSRCNHHIDRIFTQGSRTTYEAKQ